VPCKRITHCLYCPHCYFFLSSLSPWRFIGGFGPPLLFFFLSFCSSTFVAFPKEEEKEGKRRIHKCNGEGGEQLRTKGGLFPFACIQTMNNTPRHDNERRLNKQKMAAKQKDRLAWRCSAFLCVFLSKEKSKWKRQLKSHTTQGTTVPLCLFIEKKKKSGRDKKGQHGGGGEEEARRHVSPFAAGQSVCLSPPVSRGGEGLGGREGSRQGGRRRVRGKKEEKPARTLLSLPLLPLCLPFVSSLFFMSFLSPPPFPSFDRRGVSFLHPKNLSERPQPPSFRRIQRGTGRKADAEARQRGKIFVCLRFRSLPCLSFLLS